MRFLFLTGIVFSICCAQNSFAQITTFPYQEDFEGSHGFTFSGTNSSWEVGTPSGVGFHVAYSGTGALGTHLSGNHNDAELSYATSPVFDFSGLTDDPILSFFLNYEVDSCCDFLYVEVSNNNGISWTRLGNLYSSVPDWSENWYNSPSGWFGGANVYAFTQHTLPGLAGSSQAQFRFVLSANGSDTYAGAIIDQITVKENPAVEVGLNTVSLLTTDPYSLGSTESLQVGFYNLGTDSLDEVVFKYELTSPLGSTTLDSVTFTYSVAYLQYAVALLPMDLTAEGGYSVKVYSSLTGDQNPYNDTLYGTFVHRSVQTEALPIHYDFEGLDTAQFLQGQEVPGVSGWYYDDTFDSNGQLQLTDDPVNGGNRSLCLVAGNVGYHELLLTLDLSGYDVSDDELILSLDQWDGDNFSSSNDVVSIRGNANTTPFVTLYDWQLAGDNEAWTSIRLNLSDYLAKEGQNYSGLTQIQFKQTANNISGTDKFCLDNIQLFALQTNARLDSLYSLSDTYSTTSTDTVALQVTLEGKQAVDTVTTFLEVTWPDHTTTVLSEALIGSFQDTTFTYYFSGLDLSNPGIYSFRGWVQVTGDEIPSDDTLAPAFLPVAAPAALPYFEDFESVPKATYTDLAIPNGTQSLYFTPNGTPGRLRITDAFAPYSGSQAMILDNVSESHNEVVIGLDLTGKTVASNKIVLTLAMRDFGDETDDEDRIFVRGSSEDAWAELFDWSTEVSAEWQLFSMSLSETLAAVGQEFSANTQLKISQSDNFPTPTDGVAIDDIRVLDLQTDIALVSIAPVANELNATEKDFSVTIANNGVNTLSNVPITLELMGIAGTLQVTDTLTGPLLADDTVSFDFLNVPLNGFNRFEVSAYVNGTDDLSTNDFTAPVSFLNVLQLDTLPYFEGFEGTYSILVDDVSNASWEVGEPTGTVISEAYSGTNAMVTNLDGPFNGSENGFLLSPYFDFSGLSVDPEVSFALQYDLPESTSQTLRIDVSLDSGNTWWVLDNGWYEEFESWDASSDGWRRFRGPITGAAGQSAVRIRWYYRAGFGNAEEGVAIDNILVFTPSTTDASTVDLQATSRVGLSAAEMVNIWVVNEGVDSLAGGTVDLWAIREMQDTTLYSTTFSEPLLPGDSLLVTVDSIDLSVNGLYTLVAWVTVAGDSVSFNDSLRKEVFSYPQGTLPYAEDFEQLGSLAAVSGDVVTQGLFFESDAQDGEFYTQSRSKVLGDFSGYMRGDGLNTLTLALDLSGRTAAIDPTFLSFNYEYWAGVQDSLEGVYVRGSSQDEWLLIFDYYSKSANYNTQPSGLLALGDTLVKYGQEFSGSTQIQWVHLGNSNWNDLILIDQIVVADGPVNLYTFGGISIKNGPLRDTTGFDEMQLGIGNLGPGTVDSVTLKILVFDDLNNVTIENITRTYPVLLGVDEQTSIDLGELPIDAPGLWFLDVLIEEPLDTDVNNNRAIRSWSLIDLLSEYPYQHGFESSDPDYFPINYTWEIGEPANTTLSAAPEGTQAAVTNVDGNYFNYAGAYLSTPAFDFTRYGAAPIVSFDLQYQMADANDYVVFEVSIDGGDNWEIVGTSNFASDSEFGTHWYNTPNGWSGSSSGVQRAQHEVPQAIGEPYVQFRWYLRTDDSGVDEGVLVDDFQIQVQEVSDARLFAMSSGPLVVFDSSSTGSIELGITNNGFSAIPELAVFLNDEQRNTLDSADISDTLAVLDSTTITWQSIPVSDIATWYEAFLDSTQYNTQTDQDTVTFQTFRRTADSLPYYQDFNSWVIDQSSQGPIPGDLNAYVVGEGVIVDDLYWGTERRYALGVSGEGETSLVFTFDLDGTPTDAALALSFDWYLEEEGDSDLNGVFVRGSSTEEWLPVVQYRDLQPGISRWISSGKLNLSPVLNQRGQSLSSTTQVRFGREVDLSFLKLYLDNISMELLTAPDYAIVFEEVPSSGVGLSATESVVVTVTNDGKATTDSATVSLQITNPGGTVSTISKQLAGPWGFGEVRSSSFDGLDFSLAGTYEILVVGSSPADANPANDTVKALLTSQTFITDFPYGESFEADQGTFYATGERPTWEWGIPSGDVLDGAFDGLKAWATNLDGDYADDERSYLYLPPMDLSTLTTDPVFSFQMRRDLPSCCEYIELQVSEDGGQTWEALGSRAVDSSATASLIKNWETGGQWRERVFDPVTHQHPLSGLSGHSDVRLRYFFYSVGFAGWDGIVLDDIQVFEYSTTNAALAGLEVPSSIGLTANETLSAYVKNVGEDTITGGQFAGRVISEANDTTSYSQVFVDTLVPGDSLLISVSGIDLSAEGTYTHHAWVTVAGDGFPFNDTLQTTSLNAKGVAFPYKEDWEDASLTIFQPGEIVGNGLIYNSEVDDGEFFVTTSSVAATEDYLGFMRARGLNTLTLVADLSDKSVATDTVFFAFHYQFQLYDPDSVEGVYVRGSRDDEWILLFDYYSQSTNLIYQTSPAMSLSDTLAKYGQEFSAGTEIQWVHKGRTQISEGLFLDNIVLTKNAVDLGIDRGPFHANRFVRTAAELDELEMELTNHGPDAVDSITILFDIYDFRLSSRQVFERVYDISIAPNETIEFGLGDLPMDEQGLYSISVEILDSLDINKTNNFNSYNYEVVERISDYPYQHGFETTDTDYYRTNTNFLWQVGEPNDSQLSAAPEGTQALVTRLSEDYYSFVTDYVYTPYFDFSRYPEAPIVSFQLQYETSDAGDYLNFQVSTDQGLSWQTLGTENYLTDSQYGQNWYNSANGWTGSSGGVVTVQHEVPAAKGASDVRFRWLFKSDAGTDEGFLIDDFQVQAREVSNALVYRVSDPYAISFGTADTVSEPILVGVTNNGFAAIPSLSVGVYDAEGDSLASYTLSDTLDVFDSVSLNVGTFPITSSLATYQVVLDSSQNNEVTDQDTLKILAFQRSPLPLPFSEDFNTRSFSLGEGPFQVYPNAYVTGENANVLTSFGNPSLQTGMFVRGAGETSVIFTFDLSDQAPTDTFLLSFTGFQLGMIADPGNAVFVRGSSQDDWVSVVTYLDLANLSVIFSSGWLNLTEALVAAGQSYSSTTQVRFGREGISNNDFLYLDNLEIIAVSGPDIQLSNLATPGSGIGLGDQRDIDVKLTNEGAGTADSVALTLNIIRNDTLHYTSTRVYPGPWDPQESRDVTFDSLDFFTVGHYKIEVFASLPSDVDNSNDTLRTSRVTQPLISSFPYLESFESDAGLYYSGAVWEWGSPSGAQLSNAYDGSKAWGTHLAGDYPNNTISSLNLPLFDFSALAEDPVISFRMDRELETGADYIEVQVSLDSGRTWERLGARTEDADADSTKAMNWDDQGRWDGISNGYLQHQYPLTGLMGESDVLLRFHFSSNNTGTAEGVLIDQVEVKVINQAPVLDSAFADVVFALTDGTYTLDLSDRFSDPNPGDTLTYSVVSLDTAVVTPGTTTSTEISLVAQEDGTAEVVVVATDGEGLTATDTLQVLVGDAPSLVSALTDETYTQGFGADTLDVSNNYSSLAGYSITYSVFAQDTTVVNATVLNSSEIQVTEVGLGTTQVVLSASNDFGSTTDTLTVTVEALPPTLSQVIPDTALIRGFSTWTLACDSYFSESDGDALSYSVIISDTTVVSLASISGDTVTFTEVGEGATSITLMAQNPEGETAEDSFDLTVTNRAPTASGISDRTESLDAADISLALQDYFSDADGHALTYSASVDDTAVVRVVSVSGSTLTLEMVSVGTTTVNLSATDPYGASVSDAFGMTVVTNQAPGGSPTVVTPLDESTVINGLGEDTVRILVTELFSDPDNDVLAYSVQNSAGTVVGAEMVNDFLEVIGLDYGTAQITLTATDPDGNAVSTTGSFLVNSAPVVTGSLADTLLNSGFVSWEIDLSEVFTDPERDSLTYSVSQTESTVANLSLVGVQLMVTPGTAVGTTELSITATDANGAATTETVSLAFNQAPMITASQAPADTTVREGFASLAYELADIFTDADGDVLSYSVTTEGTSVQATQNGSLVTLTEAALGTTTVTLEANDGRQGVASVSFLVTVNTITNTVPAVAETLPDITVTLADGEQTVDLSEAFTDADGDSLAYSVEQVTNSVASATVQGNTLLIQPSGLGFTTFTVNATDPDGAQASQSFRFTVEAANQVPVFTAPGIITLTEGFSDTTLILDHFFSDPEDDTLRYILTANSNTSAVEAGILGQTLTLTEGSATGTAEISISAEDSDGAVVEGTVTVTVEPQVVSGLFELATEFGLYPVPTADRLTFSLNLKEAATVSLYVTNALGQRVLSQELGVGAEFHEELSLAGQPSGMFYLSVILDGKRFAYPVLKE
ncbi:MAG TPA: hypothetical protein DCE41_27520 [Cytophagales bacterium]|nr:hypothetical protein [Cytophagales bacterium]